MYSIYIIQSLKRVGYYIGHAKDVRVRLARHNSGKVRSTKSGLPWTIIHTEKFETKQEAYRRELEIKSYKGGNAFKKIVNTDSLSE